MTHFIIEEMQRQMGTIQIKTYGFPMSPDSVQESASSSCKSNIEK